MKLCGDKCTIACDFCVSSYVIKDKQGDYYGTYCIIKKTEVSEGGKCDDFHCFRAND